MVQQRMEAMLERLAKRYPVLNLDHTDTLPAGQDSEGSAMVLAQNTSAPCDQSDTDSDKPWQTLRQCLIQAQREGAQSLHLEPEGDQLRVRQRLISGLEERRISLQSELGRAIALLASSIRGEQDNTRAACGFVHLSNNKAVLIAETLLIPCVQGETVHFHLNPDPDARPRLDELGMDAHQVLSGCLQFPINQNPWNEDTGDDALIDVCNIDAYFIAANPSSLWSSWLLDEALDASLVVQGTQASDSARILSRLLARGATPAHLAQSLTAIVTQQPVRGICEHCSRPVHADLTSDDLPLDAASLANKDISAWLNHSLSHRYVESEGCDHCEEKSNWRQKHWTQRKSLLTRQCNLRSAVLFHSRKRCG